MRQIKVGAVQFEARDADKSYNLGVIERLAKKAKEQGAELVSFHECSISGYTFLENLNREELCELAEPVPGGPSTEALIAIARSAGLSVGAGLLERDGDKLYNCYIVVDAGGFIASHRKIHSFVHDALTCGDRYTVFDHLGCRIGILTCYDNNLPENVRITAMMGAEIILMPHVTGCLPSPMPGRGRWIAKSGRNGNLIPCGAVWSLTVRKDAGGSCAGCRRAPTRTASMPSIRTRLAWMGTRSSPAVR